MEDVYYVAVNPIETDAKVWQWRRFVGPFHNDILARFCHMTLLWDQHTQMFWESQTAERGRTEANTIAPGTREDILGAMA